MDTSTTHRARRVVLLLLLALLLGEVALRLGRPTSRLTASLDPERGWITDPDQDAMAGGVRVRTNSHGFRDGEWPAPDAPRPGLRVAVLGDSVPFGLGVERQDLFAEQLAGFLEEDAETAAAGAEVMNFAGPGFCFEKMRLTYRHLAERWQPDLVLVLLNDASQRPLQIPERGSWARRLLRHSRVHDLWLASLARQPALEARAAADVRDWPLAPRNRHHFEAMQAELLAWHRQMAERGSELVVVTLPSASHFLGPQDRRSAVLLGPWARAAGIELIDLHAPFREVTVPVLDAHQVAASPRQPGIPLELPPSLPEGTPFLAHDPGHWSALGHALAARAVADHLLARP